MINVENLTKYYQKDVCAVDRINFTIDKGEIIGLLGPNGAGKSTTLRMLTGFLKPTDGDIRVKDFTIRDNSLEIRNLMGYLPESAPLYHDMLVFDYLDFVASIRLSDSGKKMDRLRQLADLCGLNSVMHKPIGELSKGYKQRVGLAHAMMNDPEILVLDEPTSGLDPNQIVEIREIIRQIGKEKTVILSTHILSEAEATCDRVVIIHKGKIAADDKMDVLKKSATGEKAIRLSLSNAKAEEIKERLSGIDGVAGIHVEEASGGLINVRIQCRTEEDLRGNIYEKIRTSDWILLEFVQQARDLETVFRELTREN